jgi:GntR family transcriptional regulator
VTKPPAPTSSARTSPDPGDAVPVPRQDIPQLGGRVPLYQQVADQVRALIESGQLSPGDLLPSETDLMSTYAASRPTVRKAMQTLRTNGLVVTEHGRGTRVTPVLSTGPALAFNPTVVRSGPPEHTTFTTWDSSGWTDVGEPSRYQTIVAQHGHLLQVSPGEPVFILERHLRHSSGTQITHRAYVPIWLTLTLPALTADPWRTPAQLYAILTDAGYTIRWADHARAEMPTPDDTATLKIPAGIPVLLHTRVTLAADDRPLALEETRLPADRASVLTRPVQ